MDRKCRICLINKLSTKAELEREVCEECNSVTNAAKQSKPQRKISWTSGCHNLRGRKYA